MAEKESELAHSRPPLVPQPHPWLVICHGKHNQRQTFFSISEDRYYSRIIPEMCNKYICTCSYGWLVLEDYDSDDCFLWNPVSMEKVQLPLLEPPIDYDICILSSPPSDPNCHVIFIDGSNRYLMFCQPGDDEFVKQEFNLEDDFLISATTFEGKVYGLTFPRYTLVTVDFTGPILAFRQLVREGLPLPSRPENLCSEDYLVECCGELLFVHKIYLFDHKEVLDFKVFRVDLSKMVWAKVESLGERAIFLGLRQGVSCFAVEAGIRGNSIYYTERHNRSLFVFDLEDQSISISLPCPIVSHYQSVLHWIMMPLTNNI